MKADVVASALIATWVAQLKTARDRRGLFQWELADLLGTSQGLVSEWERLRTVPSLPHFMTWAEELGFELLMVPVNDSSKERNGIQV